MSTSTVRSERAIVFLVAAIQFVNILDFMVVMPLGPDFAKVLGFSNAHIGFVGGIYTAAAAVSGIAGSFFLDRLDRRSALAVAMLGLVCSTAAGGFATGLPSMLVARAFAGMFAGPAAALSLAVVADVVPPERRGRAMGVVMGSFALASILGVPAGLELARIGGWRLPFFGVAGMGLLIAGLSIFLLPPMRRHLDTARVERARDIFAFARDPAVRLSLAAIATVTVSMFALVPNFSAWFQFNAGYPRERLGLLYALGGLGGILSMRLGGVLTDRRGPVFAIGVATVFVVGDLLFGFAFRLAVLPAVVIFVTLMTANSMRMVAFSSLTTRVPPPSERARFHSATSAMQHSASAVGAMFSSLFLSELPDGRLVGFDKLAIVAAAAALLLPFFASRIQVHVRLREASQGALRVAPVESGLEA